MNSKIYKTILTLLFIWLLYQIVHSGVLLLFLILAIVFLFLYRVSPEKEHRQSSYLWVGLMFFLASIVFTTAFWVLLSVFLLIELNSDQKLLNTIRDPLFRKKQYWREKEFISVEWEQNHSSAMKLYRNKWFGDDFEGKDVFSWDDKNFQKFMGDTFFDLGNTILPKKENILLIRKGFGDTKLLVPQDIAISLDVSLGLGKLIIKDEVFDMKNENVRWKSENYDTAARKIKVVSSTLLGEVEVVYL